jgi:hypothetical protein
MVVEGHHGSITTGTIALIIGIIGTIGSTIGTTGKGSLCQETGMDERSRRIGTITGVIKVAIEVAR